MHVYTYTRILVSAVTVQITTVEAPLTLKQNNTTLLVNLKLMLMCFSLWFYGILIKIQL